MGLRIHLPGQPQCSLFIKPPTVTLCQDHRRSQAFAVPWPPVGTKAVLHNSWPHQAPRFLFLCAPHTFWLALGRVTATLCFVSPGLLQL